MNVITFLRQDDDCINDECFELVINTENCTIVRLSSNQVVKSRSGIDKKSKTTSSTLAPPLQRIQRNEGEGGSRAFASHRVFGRAW